MPPRRLLRQTMMIIVIVWVLLGMLGICSYRLALSNELFAVFVGDFEVFGRRVVELCFARRWAEAAFARVRSGILLCLFGLMVLDGL